MESFEKLMFAQTLLKDDKLENDFMVADIVDKIIEDNTEIPAIVIMAMIFKYDYLLSLENVTQAEVLWQDGQGAPLTGNVTTSQMANEQGLFDVHSVLRVVLGANGTYSCLVRNPVLQQDAHGSVTITGRG